MDVLIFRIDPVAKPRMTQSDRWKQRPAVLRYRAFCDSLRLQAREEGFVLGDRVGIAFSVPMPASWSKKKKVEMNGTPCQSKPDLDNLCKSVLDALMAEDKTVWKLQAEKRWSISGMIEILNL